MSIKNRRRRRRRRRRSTEQYELYAVHREMILLNISTSILYVRRRRRRLRKEKSLVKSLEGCICISCSQRDYPPQEEKREEKETTFSTLYTAARERERERLSLVSPLSTTCCILYAHKVPPCGHLLSTFAYGLSLTLVFLFLFKDIRHVDM